MMLSVSGNQAIISVDLCWNLMEATVDNVEMLLSDIAWFSTCQREMFVAVIYVRS